MTLSLELLTLVNMLQITLLTQSKEQTIAVKIQLQAVTGHLPELLPVKSAIYHKRL